MTSFPLFPARFKRGEIIAGRYRVNGVLAAGGQGECYDVVHVFTDQVGVLKVLHTDLRENAELASRVHQEAKRLGKLKHPNIVPVRDGGLTDGVDGLPFFVMEKLNGCTLQDVISGFGPVDPFSACSFGADISYGLLAIHQLGLIHGDIKLDNLFAHFESDSVRAVVLDFGITVQSSDPDTPAAVLALTPPFASPEHYDGFITYRSDLYCLGVVLYVMLTGVLPYHDGTSDDYYRAAHTARDLRPKPIAHVNPRRDIPPELDALVMQLLEKEPERRPHDAFTTNAVFKALIKQVAATTQTAPKLPEGLVDYIVAKRLTTNIPSGPKSISVRRELSFAPFPAVTPGSPGPGAPLPRQTVNRATALATRPVPIRDAANLAPVLIQEVSPLPRPAVLSLVRTRPFAPSPQFELGQRAPGSDDAAVTPVRGTESTSDTEPDGPLYPFESPAEPDLSSPQEVPGRAATIDPAAPTSDPAEAIVKASAPSLVDGTAANVKTPPTADGREELRLPSSDDANRGRSHEPRFADTDPGGTPWFVEHPPGVYLPTSAAPSHNNEQPTAALAGSASSAVTERAASRIAANDGDQRSARPAWAAFVFPVDWSTFSQPDMGAGQRGSGNREEETTNVPRQAPTLNVESATPTRSTSAPGARRGRRARSRAAGLTLIALMAIGTACGLMYRLAHNEGDAAPPSPAPAAASRLQK